jgi:DNA-binding HxlR family transcriptional regulator
MATAKACPVETALAIVGGKWKVAILWGLMERDVLGFADLRREVEGISEKVLGAELRELEADGMIVRRVLPAVPPRVEYRLSELGLSFTAPLDALCAWGERYLSVRPPPRYDGRTAG